MSQNTRALEFGSPVHVDWPRVGTETLQRAWRSPDVLAVLDESAEASGRRG